MDLRSPFATIDPCPYLHPLRRLIWEDFKEFLALGLDDFSCACRANIRFFEDCSGRPPSAFFTSFSTCDDPLHCFHAEKMGKRIEQAIKLSNAYTSEVFPGNLQILPEVLFGVYRWRGDHWEELHRPLSEALICNPIFHPSGDLLNRGPFLSPNFSHYPHSGIGRIEIFRGMPLPWPAVKATTG